MDDGESDIKNKLNELEAQIHYDDMLSIIKNGSLTNVISKINKEHEISNRII